MSPAASILGRDKSLVGMVHVAALPGTPRNSLSMPKIVRQAADEAKLLIDSGFDALLLENMPDAPYLRREVGPEIIAAMTMIACAVRASVKCPLGIQVLARAYRAALA